MRSLAFLSHFLLATLLTAQQTEVTRYDVDQGLPQSMVNHVLQDRDGFIWLGTGDGLARFDGHRFVVYKHDPRDTSSISHNAIWSVSERDARHLWIGTRSGLDILDRYTGRATPVAAGDHATDGCWWPLSITPSRSLFYSPLNASMLSVTAEGPQRTPTGLSPSYVMHYDLLDGTLTQVLGRDTLHTQRSNGTVSYSLLPVDATERITDLIPMAGRWLVLTTGGGWTWSLSEGRRALPATADAWLSGAPGTKRGRVDTRGRLWLAISGRGVIVLDSLLNVERAYPLVPLSERPLNLTSITFDAQGNTWVGSDGKGVFRIAPQRIKFGRCMPGQGATWEPRSWFVRGFAQWDEHRVLVSFYQGGLALFDERLNTLAPLELERTTLKTLKDADFQHPRNDRNGLIWGGDLFQVYAIDPVSERLVYEQHTPMGNSTALGTDGDLLVLTPNGLNAMRSNGGIVAAENVRSPRLVDHYGRNGRNPERFFVTPTGTQLFGQAVLPMQAWRHDSLVDIGPLLPSVRFTSIVPQGEAHLWATSNDGLYRLNAHDLRITGHWTIHQGLPDQYLYGMLPDGDGAWWISSNKGLSHFDPAAEHFTNYGISDGLQSTEFNSHAYFRSRSGRLYFGGVNGFNHFAPGPLMKDTVQARVALIGLIAQDSAVARTAGLWPTTLELPYGRNNLRMDLAVLAFGAPELARYRYRIAGHTAWSEHTAERPIEITDLPAGTYAIDVMGINPDGLESAATTLLTVHVPLPFRASPWASVLGGGLLVAVIAGALLLYYRQRTRRAMERSEQELKELRIRARIAQDLHDDLGSGLARISALSHTTARGLDRGEDIHTPVGKLTNLSQELMHDLRDVVWTNDPRGGPLAEVLLRIKEHLQDLFEGSGTHCTFHLPAPLPERPLGATAKRALYLIAKEAAHNARKYSEAEEVRFTFAIDDAHFTMSLTDNGKGHIHQPTTTGHGLHNMQDRATEIGCRLTAGARANGGFEVILDGALAALDL